MLKLGSALQKQGSKTLLQRSRALERSPLQNSLRAKARQRASLSRSTQKRKRSTSASVTPDRIKLPAVDSNSPTIISSPEVVLESPSPAVLKKKTQSSSVQASATGLSALHQLYALPVFSKTGSSSSSVQAGSSSSSAAVLPEPAFVQYLDSRTQTMVRRYSNRLVHATMLPGNDGFAVAKFPDEVELQPTPLPNLLLPLQSSLVMPAGVAKRPAMKRPASQADVLKRPSLQEKLSATDMAEDAEEEHDFEDDQALPEEEVAEQSPDLVPCKYIKMWYAPIGKRTTGAWAIREAPGKQLFQISNRQKSKSELEVVIDQGLALLARGKAVDEVKATCKARAATL